MNSGPRWLISITPMPEPCQSSISAAAWRSTGSGRAAGPAEKLNTRATLLPRGLARVVGIGGAAVAVAIRIAVAVGIAVAVQVAIAVAVFHVRIGLDHALQARQLGPL